MSILYLLFHYSNYILKQFFRLYFFYYIVDVIEIDNHD